MDERISDPPNLSERKTFVPCCKTSLLTRSDSAAGFSSRSCPGASTTNKWSGCQIMRFQKSANKTTRLVTTPSRVLQEEGQLAAVQQPGQEKGAARIPGCRDCAGRTAAAAGKNRRTSGTRPTTPSCAPPTTAMSRWTKWGWPPRQGPQWKKRGARLLLQPPLAPASGGPQMSSCVRAHTPRMTQWDWSAELGHRTYMTKFVEWPVVERVPVRLSTL